MKLRARTSVVGTITASLALALAGPALAANASADASSAVSGAALARFPEFAGLTDSKSLSDPLMLQGKLTDTTGKDLGGAQVLMAAWPSAEAQRKLPVGGRFSVVPVARTKAANDGSYELRSLITPLLMSLTGQDGLDVELDVFHGGRHYLYLTQLKSTTGGWIHDFVHGVDGQAADLTSKATNALDLSFAPDQGEPLDLLSESPRVPVDRHPGPGVPCLPYEKVATKEVWTTLVTGVARDGATMKITYAKGAKTVTTTGFSFNNGVTFSAGGARERTSSVKTSTFAHKTHGGEYASRMLEAQVDQFVYRRECVAERYGKYKYHYLTAPGGLTGGFRNIEDSVRAPVPCQSENTRSAEGMQRIATDNAKAYTYERAFSFAPVPGTAFSGRALSGYSEQVQVEFKFSTVNGQWCGHSARPLESGQLVQGFEK